MEERLEMGGEEVRGENGVVVIDDMGKPNVSSNHHGSEWGLY